MNAIGAVSAVTSSSVSGAGSISSVTNSSPIATGSVDTSATTQETGNSFLDSLSNAFSQVNGQLTAADASMASFASGGSADLHTVMLQMQEASVSLKTAVQVRDKLLEAYQEIMRTQI
jgi:flagellar hook-basal body complex protein FliE